MPGPCPSSPELSRCAMIETLAPRAPQAGAEPREDGVMKPIILIRVKESGLARSAKLGCCCTFITTRKP